MGDPPTPTSSSNFYGILGLPKSASIGDIGKAYKFLATKWNPERNSSNKAEAEARIKSIDEAYRVLSGRKREEGNGSNSYHDGTKSPEGSNHYHRSSENSIQNDDFIISNPSLISSTSRRVTPTGTPRASLSKSSSRRSITPTSRDFYSHSRSSSEISNPASPSTPTDPVALYKMASKRNSTPIIFSQSTVKKIPPPIEKKLECTLEELCHGCVKKVMITREVISNEGVFVEEEEILKIRIKPGWKKGTKITFEGKGDEKPGMHPADIIFVIEEKRHPIFKREGDDLELGVEIPLAEALTGCTLSVPLLGGGKINLSLGDEEIIFPGYEKIISGQGMPCRKEGGTTISSTSSFSRGDLRLRFLVEFPEELTDEQRSDIVSILQQDSS